MTKKIKPFWAKINFTDQWQIENSTEILSDLREAGYVVETGLINISEFFEDKPSKSSNSKVMSSHRGERNNTQYQKKAIQFIFDKLKSLNGKGATFFQIQGFLSEAGYAETNASGRVSELTNDYKVLEKNYVDGTRGAVYTLNDRGRMVSFIPSLKRAKNDSSWYKRDHT
jgi:hypothetical protein